MRWSQIQRLQIKYNESATQFNPHIVKLKSNKMYIKRLSQWKVKWARGYSPLLLTCHYRRFCLQFSIWPNNHLTVLIGDWGAFQFHYSCNTISVDFLSGWFEWSQYWVALAINQFIVWTKPLFLFTDTFVPHDYLILVFLRNVPDCSYVWDHQHWSIWLYWRVRVWKLAPCVCVQHG